ncbi:hypothetical protein LOTGIDRAFT_179801 [Lottia gigantea]|uniref:ArfGAP with SH3 domain, ANK repeat and PH domain-containing protein n=1 Tax=Lottia gigantea TaxID=225164 RepID=V3YYI1_LOTGI|nr:hypothetical protein LOTGIDRAFT_179801 [Lottia gigantea]ESO83203.1 hypothetical protein LOTGIDRAFT_179801 [Lottia gigantea]
MGGCQVSDNFDIYVENGPLSPFSVVTRRDTLDLDRSGLTKMKKSVKALYNSGLTHVANEAYLSENLERLGNIAKTRDQESEICAAFVKFSHVTKELSAMMKNLMQSLNNIVLYPLDAFLKGDLKGVKGDLKKPFDKAWKDYESKFTKIEKEKKQQAKEAGMIRTEVSGAEIADEMEKERKMFQLQMCEYLIKVNEIKTKKGVDLLQYLVEYYQAQSNFFQDGLKTITHFHSFVEELVHQLHEIKTRQDKERKQLIELRDSLKSNMTIKEPTANSAPSGYSLHQLQGNKIHGSEKNGYLLKKSEGRMRRVWQKRKCGINNGIMSISHQDESKDPVRLNLLTCQVKLIHDDPGKKCFDLVSSSNNRTYHLQGDDTRDMEEWISVLNNAKEDVLLKAFQDSTNSPSMNQSVRELTSSIIDRVKRLPGNRFCCDCGCPDPEWLSTNLGVILCLECCGIHRELGVHISRTQSIVIDDLCTSQLLLSRVVGNTSFNDIMEATLDTTIKPKSSSPMSDKRDFIRAKYEQHRYAIITCPVKEELKQDLKQAILSKDIFALLQVYAEGLDLMTTLPDSHENETALHLAIKEEDGTSLPLVDFIVQNSPMKKVCSGLLQREVPSGSLDKRNADGDSALHLCSQLNQTECMKLLLRTRPDLAKVENKNGETPLDVAQELNHQLCIELINAATSGKKDLFAHVNIDWDLISDERMYDFGDFSDDELDGTPDKSKPRSRPPSLIMIPEGTSLSGKESSYSGRDRTDSESSTRLHPPAPPPAQNKPKIRNKKPPPPPPPTSSSVHGHSRNRSEPNASYLIHKRTCSDPPPRPVPPDFRNTINIPQGGVAVLPTLPHSDSSDKPPSNPRYSRGTSLIEGQRCRALYDCEADNEDELSFKEGEIIVILREEEEEWWEGEIEKEPFRRGLFPVSFVKICPG